METSRRRRQALELELGDPAKDSVTALRGYAWLLLRLVRLSELYEGQWVGLNDDRFVTIVPDYGIAGHRACSFDPNVMPLVIQLESVEDASRLICDYNGIVEVHVRDRPETFEHSLRLDFGSDPPLFEGITANLDPVTADEAAFMRNPPGRLRANPVDLFNRRVYSSSKGF